MNKLATPLQRPHQTAVPSYETGCRRRTRRFYNKVPIGNLMGQAPLCAGRVHNGGRRRARSGASSPATVTWRALVTELCKQGRSYDLIISARFL
jgi:hypothetical protein